MKPLSPGVIIMEACPGSMAMASIMTFSVMLGGLGEYMCRPTPPASEPQCCSAFLRPISATLFRLLKRCARDSVWASPVERTGSLALRRAWPGAWWG